MKPITWNRALVTGASTGIGKAMAQELARQGTALVLVARNVERLEKLAASMDVPAEVLPADLTDPGQLDLVARRCAAADEPIDLLVNNAGIWSFGALTGPDGDGADAMVALNVAAVVALSRSAARQMTEAGRARSSTSPPSPDRSRFPSRPCTPLPRHLSPRSGRACTRSCGGPAWGSPP